MLLVIDNYDSFTYNLVQYLGELGQTVEVRRNDEVSVDQIEVSLRPEKIVISPGPGTPDDAGISLKVIERFAGKVPLLGRLKEYRSSLKIIPNRGIKPVKTVP